MNKKTPAGQPAPEPNSDNVPTMQLGYLGVTPPPNPAPQHGERMWVDRSDQLLFAVSVLKQASVVAIDAEFVQIPGHIQGDTSSPAHRLALLQLAIASHCFVVDALRLANLSPLRAVVENPNMLILLHGAGADLQVMESRDLQVAHYCDLEAASRSIFGPRESSLAAMLQRALAIHLDKSLQRTDWTRRPLPSAMVAYAARDAEMTLALYGWLKAHYLWALQLHEHTSQEQVAVAAWIEPFLRSTSPAVVEVALAEAKAQGVFNDQEQIHADCRAALATLKHPTQRSRLLRLIGDLLLKGLAPEIESLLRSPAADDRSASIRLLGRLGVENVQALLLPLLEDPVEDVRKSAHTALRNQGNKGTGARAPLPASALLTDGTRSWTIGDTNEASNVGDQDDWRARLRSMIDE